MELSEGSYCPNVLLESQISCVVTVKLAQRQLAFHAELLRRSVIAYLSLQPWLSAAPGPLL